MEPYEKDVKLKTKQNRNPISFINLAECVMCLNMHGIAPESAIQNTAYSST